MAPRLNCLQAPNTVVDSSVYAGVSKGRGRLGRKGLENPTWGLETKPLAAGGHGGLGGIVWGQSLKQTDKSKKQTDKKTD